MRLAQICFAALVLLSSCAKPETIIEPVKVDVPVTVPCNIEPIPAPDFALAHVQITDSLYDKVKAAIVEVLQRKAYEAPMEAAIKSCSQHP